MQVERKFMACMTVISFYKRVSSSFFSSHALMGDHLFLMI